VVAAAATVSSIVYLFTAVHNKLSLKSKVTKQIQPYQLIVYVINLSCHLLT